MNWNSPTDTGWFVKPAEDRTAIGIFDPSGVLRGELVPADGDEGSGHVGKITPESDADRYAPLLRKGKPVTFRLPDGTTGTLIDQKPKAMRRKNKLCEVVISGRRYLFVHSSGRKATAFRDGTALARLVRDRGWRASTVTRKNLVAADVLDECVLTVFDKIVTPGRTGAFDQVMTDLSNI